MTPVKYLIILIGLLLFGGSSGYGISMMAGESEIDKCVEAYVNKMTECILEDAETTFELIYVDEDDIPELAAGRRGFYVSVFTYGENGLTTVMDQWTYGAMGIAGYEYSPYNNVMRNYDADYAGQILWLNYWMIGDNGEYQDVYKRSLCTSLYNDIYEMKDSVEFDENKWYYFYGEEEITKEEYEEYLIDGEYQYIELGENFEETIDELFEIKDKLE